MLANREETKADTRWREMGGGGEGGGEGRGVRKGRGG